jgi:S1-C subfamily serine protease
MQLDSARGLKQLVSDTILASLTAGSEEAVRSFALAAGPMANVMDTLPSLALGLTHKKGNQYHLAVRCQRQELMDGKEVQQIRKKAKNEVDVRFIGRLRKRATPGNQKKVRPLQIGLSCGHFKITAGTLGCFVRLRGDAATLYILSNNHVLAAENKAKVGDGILLPGPIDGGKNPQDLAANFTRTVKLKKTGVNFIDAAIAEVKTGLQADLRTIKGLGKLAGLGPTFVDEGTEVAKLGRTTGLTRGRVTAFELDNVVVGYDLGNLRFDN